MSKYYKFFTFCILLPTIYTSHGCDFVEKYKKENFKLFPCKPCTNIHQFFTKPEPLPADLQYQLYKNATRENIKSVIPCKAADLCNASLIVTHNFPYSKKLIQAIAQKHKVTYMTIQPKSLEMPYKSSVIHKLRALLAPYAKKKEKCIVLIEPFDDLNHTTAQAFRCIIKMTHFQDYLSFIFLRSKYSKIKEPEVNELLNYIL